MYLTMYTWMYKRFVKSEYLTLMPKNTRPFSFGLFLLACALAFFVVAVLYYVLRVVLPMSKMVLSYGFMTYEAALFLSLIVVFMGILFRAPARENTGSVMLALGIALLSVGIILEGSLAYYIVDGIAALMVISSVSLRTIWSAR